MAETLVVESAERATKVSLQASPVAQTKKVEERAVARFCSRTHSSLFGVRLLNKN
jgi:hypothetical protein